MNSQPLVVLNDGHIIPQVGLGVWQTPADKTSEVVQAALSSGYRHVDTAAMYGNEAGVGDGVRSAHVDRKDVFVTTKLWSEDQGFDKTLQAFDKSLKRLGLEYVDLYLIHWPSPQRDKYVDTWRALARLKEEGRLRSAGVSNFEAEHLHRIIDETGLVPVLNQIELHPRFQQRKLRKLHAKLGIAIESWSPLGRGSLLEDRAILAIAKKHGRTPAQIIIRWHIDNGLIVIPKSANPVRIRENLQVFDFGLDEADLAAIEKLDSAEGRMGPNPMTASF
jgi:2,5-diketo-D-gluconate reductase A